MEETRIHPLDHQIERCLQAFAFATPFAVFGMTIGGGYILSVATVILLIADLLILVRGKFWSGPLVAVVLFLLWCFLTAVGRYEVSSYLPSLLALSAMLLPIVASISTRVDSKKILKAFNAGLIASFPLGVWDIGVNLGLPTLTDTFPLGLWGTDYIQESIYFGFYRVKAAQTEPSHYAHYLVFAYSIVDQADRRGLTIQNMYILKIFTVLLIFLTVSLSGLIMLISYWGAVVVSDWRSILYKRLYKFKFWVYLTIGIVFLFVALQWIGEDILEYTLWLWGRMEEAIVAIQLGLVAGSEASRAYSAVIVFEYWANQDWFYILFGEGYANHQQWLMQEYSYLQDQNVSFARGDIHNNFAMLGIATGVIGLLAYLLFVITFYLNKNLYVPFSIFAVWIVSHFAMGYFSFYRFWFPIILSTIIFSNQSTQVR